MSAKHPWLDPTKYDLTTETLRQLLDYDSATGVLTWRFTSLRPSNWNCRFARKPAGGLNGNPKRLVISITVGGKDRRYQASVLAWLWMTGEWPVLDVDHRNMDRLDCRWENLRLATAAENNCNKNKSSRNTTGVKGVYYDKSRQIFRSRPSFNGQRRCLGSFRTLEEAAAAYARAVEELHGEFARTA